MTRLIMAKFDGIGWAEAYPVLYEAFQEAYQVHVFTNGGNREYEAIRRTICWGMDNGFTVLSADGKTIEQIIPEIDGDLVKTLRFVKDYVKTLTGGNIQ
mgnify:CR=1 FL=1